MDGSPSRGLLTSSFCPVSADEVMLLRSGGVFRGFSLTYFSPGETIPIRLFLGGFDLTPTFRDVNKKFSTRYYLSLVLIDEGKAPHTLFLMGFRNTPFFFFFPTAWSRYIVIYPHPVAYWLGSVAP